MKETKVDILDQPDYGVREARGVLAKLFRTVMKNIGFTNTRWEVQMQRVLDDPRNPVPRNSKDRSSFKGNLNKALKGDRMTWKVFEKALRFLGPRSIRFEIHCTWGNGETSIHGFNQDLGGFRVEDYMLDEESQTGQIGTSAEAARARMEVIAPKPAAALEDPTDLMGQLAHARRIVNQVAQRHSRAELKRNTESL